jgi:hypothetical protein
MSVKMEKQRLNASHETVPEASKPKHKRPNRPEFPNPTRHFVPWFPGRKNGFAQMCAGCKTEVAEGAGHLAKISSEDSTWHVFCDECRTTGGMITVPGSDDPEEIAVQAKQSRTGMVTFKDIEKAGKAHFARQHAAAIAWAQDYCRDNPPAEAGTTHFDNVYSSPEWKLGVAYARQELESIPYTPPMIDFEVLKKISADIERSLSADFGLILNAPSNPGATLQEAYRKRQAADPMNSPSVPRPEKPTRVSNEASRAGFHWADSCNLTSERDTMLGAGFGEMPPSTLRKHRTKRPKRVGW